MKYSKHIFFPDVNISDAFKVGIQIIDNMLTQNVKDLKFTRNAQCKTFTAAPKTVAGMKQSSCDPELTFHRFVMDNKNIWIEFLAEAYFLLIK